MTGARWRVHCTMIILFLWLFCWIFFSALAGYVLVDHSLSNKQIALIVACAGIWPVSVPFAIIFLWTRWFIHVLNKG